MIWRTSLPYLLLGAMLCAAVALVTESHASIQRYKIAKSYIGLKEGTKAANRAMGVNTRRTPWCGYFVRKTVVRSGQKPVKGYPSAASWKRFGRSVRLSQARKGDIVVIRTRRGHHVTIYSHRKGKWIYGIGGNQSNSVKLSRYPASSVRSVRR